MDAPDPRTDPAPAPADPPEPWTASEGEPVASPLKFYGVEFNEGQEIPAEHAAEVLGQLGRLLSGEKIRGIYGEDQCLRGLRIAYDPAHHNIKSLDRAVDTVLRRYEVEHTNSFFNMLGTIKTPVLYSYAVLALCMATAVFLGWLTAVYMGIEADGTIFDEGETGVVGAVLNGLIPVAVGALFTVGLFLLVKKFGVKVLYVFFGFVTVFYDWIAFTFYGLILLILLNGTQLQYDILYYGSAVGALYLFVQAMRQKLSPAWKNFLVFFFGLTVGAMLSMMFPTWSIFFLAGFLSIWDIITVSKGPLRGMFEEVQKSNERVPRPGSGVEDDETGSGAEPSGIPDLSDLSWRERIAVLRDMEIQIGNGDLVFYSAIASHAFISTQNWWVELAVVGAILLGFVATLAILLKAKRIVPALPFSIAFATLAYFGSVALLGL